MADFLKGEVDVPVVGRTKKWVIYGLGGLAAAYVAWRWYQAGRGDEPAGDDMIYDPDLSEMGQSTAGGPLTIGGNTGATVTDGTTPGAINTNGEWLRASVDYLSSVGYDSQVVTAALGEFLARRALDPSEATIARAALGAFGQPPEGRPWSVIEEAATGTGTLPAPSGLKAGTVTDTSVSLSWSSVAGAGSYQVYRNGSAAVTVSGTTATVTGLKPSTSYRFAVAAVSTTGKTGTRSGEITVKTAAAPSTPAPSTPAKPKIPPYKEVIARPGDTISKIAARYGKSWQQVWEFNLKYRKPETVKILKQRGPNLIYSGTRIWVPL